MVIYDSPFAITAKTLMSTFRRLRDLHSEMTIQQAMFLVGVAGNPGITQRALYALLDTNDSVSSRTLALLSNVGNRSITGLDLVEMKVNPHDRRERILDLTPKGRRLFGDLQRDLKGTSQ